MEWTGTPLAERMRPQKLEDYIGQTHLMAPGKIMHQILETGSLPSMLLWGPPGVGKTSLAQLMAQHVKGQWFALSAIHAGVKEVREIIEASKGLHRSVLFIDEIHRFNKNQQDALLGAVEKGWITLIGATTENPSFEVNKALLSRCQVYTLKSFTEEELTRLIDCALAQDEWLKSRHIQIPDRQLLLDLSGGDARRLLNLLELSVLSLPANEEVLSAAVILEAAQKRTAQYDKKGEMHYDIVSAYIKSIRGSDPNAALYWLARMLEGGEEPRFIARRALIAAAEDIGLANPTALALAVAAFQATEVLGMPEARIILYEITVYLAGSPKSNSSYLAGDAAWEAVRQTGDLPVPLHLRNAASTLMKKEGYGKGYQYPHNFKDHFTPQDYLPPELKGKSWYIPASNAREEEIKRFLQARWGDLYRYL
jgi:putative ATPase